MADQLKGFRVQLEVNGESVEVDEGDGRPLLSLLRDDLHLTGTKEACSRGECGACTVLVGGLPVMSCVLPVALTDGPVLTIEGLAERSATLRAAFADTGGFQCGFCTPGQIVRAIAMLEEPEPADAGEADAAIRRGLAGNICRCTGYAGIVAAITQARDALR